MFLILDESKGKNKNILGGVLLPENNLPTFEHDL